MDVSLLHVVLTHDERQDECKSCGVESAETKYREQTKVLKLSSKNSHSLETETTGKKRFLGHLDDNVLPIFSNGMNTLLLKMQDNRSMVVKENLKEEDMGKKILASVHPAVRFSGELLGNAIDMLNHGNSQLQVTSKQVHLYDRLQEEKDIGVKNSSKLLKEIVNTSSLDELKEVDFFSELLSTETSIIEESMLDKKLNVNSNDLILTEDDKLLTTQDVVLIVNRFTSENSLYNRDLDFTMNKLNIEHEIRNALSESGNAEILKRAQFIMRGEQFGEIRLTLRPEHLGAVRINMFVDEGRVLGRVIVENLSVKEAFDDNMADLRDMFLKNGLDVDFEVDYRGQNSDKQHKSKSAYYSRRLKADSLESGQVADILAYWQKEDRSI